MREHMKSLSNLYVERRLHMALSDMNIRIKNAIEFQIGRQALRSLLRDIEEIKTTALAIYGTDANAVLKAIGGITDSKIHSLQQRLIPRPKILI
jgi:hypothetical protein